MEIKDQKIWDNFITAQNSEFLQSWDWGVLQTTLGRKIWRLGLTEKDALQATALIIKMPLPFGKSYLYSPRGPVGNDKAIEKILNEIKQLAEKENSIFYRLETKNKLAIDQLQSTEERQPAQTMILDIAQSEEKLLTSFHPKTRYNINLAKRKEVTVRLGDKTNDFDAFWDLLNKTYSKQKISTHPKEYYYKLLHTEHSSLQTKLYIAEHQNKPIAANLVYWYGDTATYVHGGSDYAHRRLMAPHLLQWQQILDAKEAEIKKYDFWGYDELKWPGVSRFKSGFSGEVINYPGTFDLPFNKTWHWLYRLAQKIRR